MITVEEVKFAEKELKELNVKLADLNAKRVNSVKELEQQVRNVINKYLIEDAVILDKDIRISIGDDGELEFGIRIGFLSEKPNYSVFGADFDFYFENGFVRLNHGTIGSYSKVTEPFQLKRIFVIANVWKNVDALEDALKAIDIKAYRELLENYHDVKEDIAMCNRVIKLAEEQKLIANIKAGNCFTYNHCSYDLKDEWIGSGRQSYVEIKSVTDKTVTYEQTIACTSTYRVKKETFVSFVLSGKLQFIGDIKHLKARTSNSATCM